MNAKVSIILPVYNVSRYLRKCLSSVTNQTYDNLEIILIDDGSTDESGSICDEYAKIDPRIRVLHQSNFGVSNARNNGIKIATGEYACIIDSDDYIDLNFIEVLMRYATELKVDLVACGVYVAEKEDGSYKYIQCSSDDSLLDTRSTIMKIFQSDGFKGWGVNKLYSMNIINKYNLRYHEDIKFCEDELFCLEYAVHVKHAIYIKETLYHYMLNMSSVNHLMYTKKKFNYDALDRLKADDLCNNIIQTYNDKEMSDLFKCRRFISNSITIDKLINNFNGDYKTLHLLTSNLRKYWWYYFLKEPMSLKKKIASLVLVISPMFFYRIMKYRNC